MTLNVPRRSSCIIFLSQGALASSSCREIFGVSRVSRVPAMSFHLHSPVSQCNKWNRTTLLLDDLWDYQEIERLVSPMLTSPCSSLLATGLHAHRHFLFCAVLLLTIILDQALSTHPMSIRKKIAYDVLSMILVTSPPFYSKIRVQDTRLTIVFFQPASQIPDRGKFYKQTACDRDTQLLAKLLSNHQAHE